MRARIAATFALLVLLANVEPASAWDPFAGEGDDAPPPAPADPAPFVVPEGIYLVTDVYTGNAVTTSGNTTTYTTTTAHEVPGTYARVIDVVGTGGASAFDGSSMNGRARLPDGRAVAGTYYEDYVLSSEGYVSVNIVFFQDDSFTTAIATPVPSAATPTPTPVARASAAPFVPPPVIPTPAHAPLVVSTPRPAVFGAGVALGETAPVLASVEVLRGRRLALWPRAFVDGASVRITSWRLVAGDADLVSSRTGDAAVPCVATWLRMPSAPSTLRFEITTEAAPGRVLVATIAVAVRSPALEQ
ncbi:MAG TPA: hypothetical protein VI814_11895 [Candidatus Limnocylindria bacterium]